MEHGWALAEGSEARAAFERSCAGKQGYPTESAADAGLRFLQDEGILRTNDGMQPYHCNFCQEWHHGH